MRKNLVYYCLGLSDVYADLFKKSVLSLDSSNKEKYDILVITNRSYYERNLKNYDRENVHYHFVEQFKNGDDICFSKLKVFDWEKIDDYENLFQVDSDVLIYMELNKIFDKCTNENKLYAPIEDKSFENHRRIYFSLGDYTDSDIEFFRNNNIHTFNCGTYVLKNSPQMKQHFSNIKRIIAGHKGDYFSDQSFMNYYFNKMKLVDYSVLNSDSNLIYVTQDNINYIFDLNDKILHFLGSTYFGETKLDKMNKILSKSNSVEKIFITNLSDDRQKITFRTDTWRIVNIEVYIGETLIQKNKVEMLQNCSHWILLNDGFYDKKIIFFNDEFSQTINVHGRQHYLEQKIETFTNGVSKNDFLSNIKDNKINFYEYYFRNFEFNKFQKLKIFDIFSEQESYDFFKNYLPNSIVFGTHNNVEEIEKRNNHKLFYYDNNSEQLLSNLFEIQSLKDNIDLIVCRKCEVLNKKNIIEKILNSIKLGGKLIFEDIKLKDIDSLSNLSGILNYSELKFNHRFFKVDGSYKNESSFILEITRTL